MSPVYIAGYHGWSVLRSRWKQGVLLNETKAFSLFKKASAQNNADGQFFTGLCYRDDVGVQQSLKKAAILFEKAAKQGLPRAQNALGECYEHGEGVEQDYFQAVKWYKKAAKQ